MSDTQLTTRWQGMGDLARALRTMACASEDIRVQLDARDALRLARIIEEHAQAAAALEAAAKDVAEVTGRFEDLAITAGRLERGLMVSAALGLVFWTVVFVWWLA
jgi:hypothetical protein